MGERRGVALWGSARAAQQSFTTPITSFGAPWRGHPCQRRGKWKSINKDKTRLGEALICRITFLICVKYHWILSLCSGGTHECTHTPGGRQGFPSPVGKSTACSAPPQSWVNPPRVPNWAVRDIASSCLQGVVEEERRELTERGMKVVKKLSDERGREKKGQAIRIGSAFTIMYNYLIIIYGIGA